MKPLVLLTLLVAAPAAAQIVNVQSVFTDDAPLGVSGGIDAAVDWRTGSNDFLALRGALAGQWRGERGQVLALARGEYGLSQGLTTLNRVLEHLRYRHSLTERWGAESFLQHEYDGFRRLQLRALLGAGPRFRLIREEKLNLALGLALMLEHERLRQDDQPDAGARTTDLRLSSYALAGLPVAENVELTETVYVQPRLDAPADLRVLNETALVVRPNAHFSLGLAFVLTWDRRPPASIAPLDTQLRTTLGFKL